MDYRKMVETIPIAKREPLLTKLIDLLLLSKNDEKMPILLANTILHHWQNDVLQNESGLTGLLEAAVTLEPEKTVETFTQLEMADFAAQLKEVVKQP